MNQREVLQKAIDTYGETNQMRQCIEEMSELTKAICKKERTMNREDSTEQELADRWADLIDETADVYVMIWQMTMILGEESVAEMIDYKIKRLQKRLEEHHG